MRFMLSFTLVLLNASLALAADAPRPNVVLIIADDLGYADVSCQNLSKDVRTPNIDSIAANGVRFTQGYVSGPVCSPSRAGLITGRYQQRFGHYHNPGPGKPNGSEEFGMPVDQVTIAEILREQGYVTGMIGKWHLGYPKETQALQRGFDEFFGFHSGSHSYIDHSGNIYRNEELVPEQEYLTDALSREAAAFIDRHTDEPFFLYLSYNAVHTPLQETPARYLEGLDDVKDPKRRTFLAMLHAMDAGIGRVLEALKKNRLHDGKTMVIFVSDNGGPTSKNTSINTPLAGGKGSVYEGGVRVPSMMQWPDHIPAGRVDNAMTIQLDYTATIATAAGAGDRARELKFDGVDLVPYLNGRADKPHQSLFWKIESKWAVRDGDLKLLQNGNGAAKLFDLAQDVGEANDLAASRAEEVKRLKALYDEWDKANVPPLWDNLAWKKNGRGGEGDP